MAYQLQEINRRIQKDPVEFLINPDPQNAQYEVWISVVKKKE